jgi:hypothetical protein
MKRLLYVSFFAINPIVTNAACFSGAITYKILQAVKIRKLAEVASS